MFEQEYEAITYEQRSPKWVQGHKDRIRLHLLPFFGAKPVSEITSGMVQEYRTFRMTKPSDWDDDVKAWKRPAKKTLHNEVVTLSMVLKTALRHNRIEYVPDLSDTYRRQSKIEHRPWFTPKEYMKLYKATGANAKEPVRRAHAWHAEQLHDFVLFATNTGLRPDELKRLEFRDVEIVDDNHSGEILEMEVRGKRGVGYCKSMPGTVEPFRRLLKRPRRQEVDGQLIASKPKQTDILFSNEFKIRSRTDLGKFKW